MFSGLLLFTLVRFCVPFLWECSLLMIYVCTTSQNGMFVTEKHDLYQTLMRLLLINSRCRPTLTQDFGIIRFQIVKGKNLYWSMYTVSCFLVCATKPPPLMYIHDTVHFFFFFFRNIDDMEKNPTHTNTWLMKYTKCTRGDTFSIGSFMICFESSIISRKKKFLGRKVELG